MRLLSVIQEVTYDGIREERRDDQRFVLPCAKGCNRLSLQSRYPEAALVFIEALWPSEPNASKFISNLRHALPTLTRERLVSKAWQGRNEIGERMICRDSVCTIRKFAVENNNGVPATIKSQVAA